MKEGIVIVTAVILSFAIVLTFLMANVDDDNDGNWSPMTTIDTVYILEGPVTVTVNGTQVSQLTGFTIHPMDGVMTVCVSCPNPKIICLDGEWSSSFSNMIVKEDSGSATTFYQWDLVFVGGASYSGELKIGTK